MSSGIEGNYVDQAWAHNLPGYFKENVKPSIANDAFLIPRDNIAIPNIVTMSTLGAVGNRGFIDAARTRISTVRSAILNPSSYVKRLHPSDVTSGTGGIDNLSNLSRFGQPLPFADGEDFPDFQYWSRYSGEDGADPLTAGYAAKILGEGGSAIAASMRADREQETYRQRIKSEMYAQEARRAASEGGTEVTRRERAEMAALAAEAAAAAAPGENAATGNITQAVAPPDAPAPTPGTAIAPRNPLVGQLTREVIAEARTPVNTTMAELEGLFGMGNLITDAVPVDGRWSFVVRTSTGVEYIPVNGLGRRRIFTQRAEALRASLDDSLLTRGEAPGRGLNRELAPEFAAEGEGEGEGEDVGEAAGEGAGEGEGGAEGAAALEGNGGGGPGGGTAPTGPVRNVAPGAPASAEQAAMLAAGAVRNDIRQMMEESARTISTQIQQANAPNWRQQLINDLKEQRDIQSFMGSHTSNLAAVFSNAYVATPLHKRPRTMGMDADFGAVRGSKPTGSFAALYEPRVEQTTYAGGDVFSAAEKAADPRYALLHGRKPSSSTYLNPDLAYTSGTFRQLESQARSNRYDGNIDGPAEQNSLSIQNPAHARNMAHRIAAEFAHAPPESRQTAGVLNRNQRVPVSNVTIANRGSISGDPATTFRGGRPTPRR